MDNFYSLVYYYLVNLYGISCIIGFIVANIVQMCDSPFCQRTAVIGLSDYFLRVTPRAFLFVSTASFNISSPFVQIRILILWLAPIAITFISVVTKRTRRPFIVGGSLTSTAACTVLWRAVWFFAICDVVAHW